MRVLVPFIYRQQILETKLFSTVIAKITAGTWRNSQGNMFACPAFTDASR